MVEKHDGSHGMAFMAAFVWGKEGEKVGLLKRGWHGIGMWRRRLGRS
jgi:hypothetical protein